MTTDRPKMINLYGSDLLGRIDLSWTSQYDYEMEEYYWVRTDSRNYYVKDHLGSIRQTLNTSGTVMSAMDYYAFGGTLSSYVNGSTVDKYKFTGKERDTETGLDYFGARYYDSKICRWMSVDPLADIYPGLSPYNYCKNNPLAMVDPHGDSVVVHGQNPGQGLSLLQEWAKTDGNRLSIGQNGMLQINTEGYEAGSNPAIDDLITMNGATEVYGVDTDPNALKIDHQSKTSFFADFPPIEKKPHSSRPPEGFDANIVFPTKVEYSNEKTGNQIPRGQIVGHEMREIYLRTHFEVNYFVAHAIANLRYYGGVNGEFKETRKP